MNVDAEILIQFQHTLENTGLLFLQQQLKSQNCRPHQFHFLPGSFVQTI